MKKIWLRFPVVLLSLFLTGCEVHWNGESADFPWFVIAIPAGIILLIGMAINGARVSSKRFVCPKCYHTFKPKWWRCLLSPHAGDDYLLRCPRCHAREACHPSYEQDA